MKLEDFAHLPKISFDKEKLIVGPISEFGEITPAIGAHRRVFRDGTQMFQNFSRGHSYDNEESRQHLIYVLGLVEEDNSHRIVYSYSGSREIKESKEVKELLKKINGTNYSLAYSDGRKKDSHRVHTVTLIDIKDVISYRTIAKGI